jgi:predicted RNA binding protein YcfA (HicA-like mRNA interferase family)
MPVFGPVSRQNLIKSLKKYGFEGPYSGGKHQTMIKGNVKVVIPNPHKGDIGTNFLTKLLKQAHISKEDWSKL